MILFEHYFSLSADENHPTVEHPPATPLGSAPPTLDSSFSSAAIQELLQQAFSASQSQGAGQTWGRSTNSNYQDSMDAGARVVLSQAPPYSIGGHPPAGIIAWDLVGLADCSYT